MRASILLLAFGAVCAAGVTVAAEPAVTPPDAYVKALQAACPGALHRGANGLCPAVSSDTEGFSLFDAPSATSTSRPFRESAPRRTQGVVRTRVATATPPVHASPPPAATGSALRDLLITFKYESAELTEHGKAQARSFAEALLDPSLLAARVEIAGHTDASGSEPKNIVLSQARAEAVKAYMVSQGVDPARLTTKGYGSRDLAVPASPMDAANRRVEARPLN